MRTALVTGASSGIGAACATRLKTSIWKRSAELAASLADGAPGGLRELYGQRTAGFARVARERGASGASADAVARVVEQALTSERPRTRLVGRDATIRAGFELLPDRVRDSVYERLLLR
jgi:NAD(P)-dependent dehydrogenase (short-subunit alcohol dehydrogenase family)